MYTVANLLSWYARFLSQRTPPRRDQRWDGERAYADGLPRNTNPHSGPASDRWFEGWDQSAEIAESADTAW